MLLNDDSPFQTRESSRWISPRIRGDVRIAALDDSSGFDLSLYFSPQLGISEPEDNRAAAKETIACSRYASPTCTIRNHEAILQFTAQLFPVGQISVTQEADPEIEDDEYFAILVETPGTVDEVVALHREWHNRIGSVAPETAYSYRLLLDIND